MQDHYLPVDLFCFICSNVKCGLLHCTGGNKLPAGGQNYTVSVSSGVSDGKSYECKLVCLAHSCIVRVIDDFYNVSIAVCSSKNAVLFQ